MPDKIPPLHRVIAGFLGLALLVVLGFVVRRSEPAGRGSVVRSSRPLMGTLFEVSVWAPAGREPEAAEAVREALDFVGDLEERISSWKPESETSTVNTAAGGEPVVVGGDLRELVSLSLQWARRTEGAFDVTGGPLFGLWEEARKKGALPTDEEIRKRLERVGHDKIELSDEGVRLSKAGMRMGFGGVAKGFAADRAATLLRARGFTNHIVEAGGDLVIRGSRGGERWNIAIRHPRRDSYLAVCEATDCAIASSGDYERFFVVEGKRYSHILDLRTGWPARGLAAVSVLARRGADADALATALLVLGTEKGLVLVESLPEVEALMVEEGSEIRFSKGLQLEDGRLKWLR